MYSFELNGKEFELPDFNNLPLGVIRKSRKFENDLDAAFSILENAAGDNSELMDELDALPMTKFNELLTAWTQGVRLGESSESSN